MFAKNRPTDWTILILLLLMLFALGVNLIQPGKVEASGTQEIYNLPIGARVVDNSWQWEHRDNGNYSGDGEIKPVTWIIVAKNHYGNDTGVTLLAEELIGRYTFDNSTNLGGMQGSNRWDYSGLGNANYGLRPWLNSNGIHSDEGFYLAFSDSFKNAILATTLLNKVWNTGNDYHTNDEVFIPSSTELGDTDQHNHSIGTTYPYFQGADNTKRAAQLGTYASPYWTRSPGTDYGSRMIIVDSDGSFYPSIAGDHSFAWFKGVRPALNLKSDTPVSASPNSNGVYIIGEATTEPPPVPTPIWTILTPASAQAITYQNGAMAASFAGFGTYLRDSGGNWTQLTGASANVLAFDGGVLAASFAGFGTYLRSPYGTWTQISSATAKTLAFDGGVLAASFDGFGTYLRDSYGDWTQVSPATANVLAFDNGILAASFVGHGTWLYDGEWLMFTPATAQALAIEGNLIAASFGGHGTWFFDDSWENITPAAANVLAFDDGILATSLAGHGVWLYDGSWTNLTTASAQVMAFDGGTLASSFEGLGVWLYN